MYVACVHITDCDKELSVLGTTDTCNNIVSHQWQSPTLYVATFSLLSELADTAYKKSSKNYLHVANTYMYMYVHTCVGTLYVHYRVQPYLLVD